MEEEFEALMRRLPPVVEIAPDRVERLIDTVFLRIDRGEVTPPAHSWRDFLRSLTGPLPPIRFAALALVAIILGAAFGREIETTGTTTPSLFTANEFLPIGS
jgi:hypothetical protein